jgi:hypothetical protein
MNTTPNSRVQLVGEDQADASARPDQLGVAAGPGAARGAASATRCCGSARRATRLIEVIRIEPA